MSRSFSSTGLAFGSLVLAFAADGCSGGGYLQTPGSGVGTPTPAPVATATAKPTAATLVTLGESGAMPVQGLAGTFVLSLAEYGANKQLISGAYAAPVTLTTNDSGDLSFAVTDPNGSSVASGSSATIVDSTASIVVTYSGNAVPAGTQISASSSGLATTTLAFTPVVGGGASAGVASITIAQIGATPVQGSAGQFALAVTALDATGAPISGTYATPISVTTNDVTDVALATTPGGPGASGVVVPNSQTPVFVTYSGNHTPNGTQFGATNGAVSATLPFTTTTPGQLTSIAKITITRVGSAPLANTPGASPFYISAYDANGTLLGGTLPSAVSVTLNDNCDSSLSVGGPSSVQDCQTSPFSNVSIVTINNPSQVVYLDDLYGASTDPATVLSASTLDNVCSGVTFPGNAETACQPQAQGAIRKSATTRIPVTIRRSP